MFWCIIYLRKEYSNLKIEIFFQCMKLINTQMMYFHLFALRIHRCMPIRTKIDSVLSPARRKRSEIIKFEVKSSSYRLRGCCAGCRTPWQVCLSSKLVFRFLRACAIRANGKRLLCICAPRGISGYMQFA